MEMEKMMACLLVEIKAEIRTHRVETKNQPSQGGRHSMGNKK
jgi:hypothetical protein